MDATGQFQFRNYEGRVVFHESMNLPLDRLTRTRITHVCDRATRSGDVDSGYVLVLGSSGGEFYGADVIGTLNELVAPLEQDTYPEWALGAVLLYEHETGQLGLGFFEDQIDELPEELPPRLQFLQEPAENLIEEIPREKFQGPLDLGEFDEAWTYATPVGDAAIGRFGESFQASLHCQEDYPYRIAGSREAAKDFLLAEVRSRYLENEPDGENEPDNTRSEESIIEAP
jgi:hypothetical protein